MLFSRRPWGRGDVWALLVWTVAIVAFFWPVVTLRGALFYFDITEINYPYRAFFAEELRAGRFSRWCPGLYCGLPLYSESQAGYLHPFKYLLYPWLETWQALNLDTVLSIWLTGVGAYGWLRRHAGPAGALTGAAVLGLGGFTWAHLIHTSMINALASLPFVIWGLEWSWEARRLRGAVLGGLALACQVFAGHLQDALFTVVLVVFYGLYRAATERGLKARLVVLTMALVLVGEGVLISAVQWVPSKELLDRSPRAGGLSWGELVFASWHPELIPTLVVREAYGTRARDTDWLDGFYPYHEMDAYLGLIAMALAVVGAGGAAKRDRWTSFWVLLIGLSAVLMLGRFTFLFDRANLIPVLGSSREPVRFSLWVSLGVAALAAVGVERLGRPGAVSLRGASILAGALHPARDPHHDLRLSPGLDRAEALDSPVSARPPGLSPGPDPAHQVVDRAVSSRSVSLAGSGARDGDGQNRHPGRARLVGRAEGRAVHPTGSPRAVGGVAAGPGHHRSSGRPLG